MADQNKRPPALQPVPAGLAAPDLLTPISASWLLEGGHPVSLDDISFSAQLPLSASILSTPHFLFNYTAAAEGDTPGVTHLREQASDLGQQVQTLMSGLQQGLFTPPLPMLPRIPSQQQLQQQQQQQQFQQFQQQQQRQQQFQQQQQYQQQQQQTAPQSLLVPSNLLSPIPNLYLPFTTTQSALPTMAQVSSAPLLPPLFADFTPQATLPAPQQPRYQLADPPPPRNTQAPSRKFSFDSEAEIVAPVRTTSGGRIVQPPSRIAESIQEDNWDGSQSSSQDQSSVVDDFNKLTNEELREELRKRGLSTQGQKTQLVERLAGVSAPRREACLPVSAPFRLYNLLQPRVTAQRAKRLKNKREPHRDDYSSQREFDEAWEQWRRIRDSNNNSVKRSRALSRDKKMEHERLCLEREKENSTLEKLVKQLKDEVALLTRMLKQPDTLNTAEQALLETLLQTNGGAPDQ